MAEITLTNEQLKRARELSDELSISEQKARFIIAIEDGEIDGDMIDVSKDAK